MSNDIYWLLEVEILPGKLENFRAVAKDLIAVTEKEAGTRAYEWNLSDDGSVCHIYERYVDDTAVATHVQSFGLFAERFLEACRPTRFHVYGVAGEESKAVLADFRPVYFSPPLGFSR